MMLFIIILNTLPGQFMIGDGNYHKIWTVKLQLNAPYIKWSFLAQVHDAQKSTHISFERYKQPKIYGSE
jgi:hypothetical protein